MQSALLSSELFRGISQFKPNVLEVTGWHYLYSAFTGEVKKTVHRNQVPRLQFILVNISGGDGCGFW